MLLHVRINYDDQLQSNFLVALDLWLFICLFFDIITVNYFKTEAKLF